MTPAHVLSIVLSSPRHINATGAGAGILTFPAKYGLDILLYRHGLPERMMMILNAVVCSVFVAALMAMFLHWARYSRGLIRTQLRDVYSLNDKVRNELQKLICLSALTTEDAMAVHIIGEATAEIVKALEQILLFVDERVHTTTLLTTAERRTMEGA